MLSVDVRPNRALIVSLETVETVDIDEHLLGQGWGPSVVVRTTDEAVIRLAPTGFESDSFSLAVIGLGIASPGMESLLDACRQRSVRILHLNGETRVGSPVQISSLARPFTTTDLEASLEALGFSKV